MCSHAHRRLIQTKCCDQICVDLTLVHVLKKGVAYIAPLGISRVRLAFGIAHRHIGKHMVPIGLERHIHFDRTIRIGAAVQDPVVLCPTLDPEQIDCIHIGRSGLNQHQTPSVNVGKPGIRRPCLGFYPLHLIRRGLKGQKPPVRGRFSASGILAFFIDHNEVVAQRTRAPRAMARMGIAQIG